MTVSERRGVSLYMGREGTVVEAVKAEGGRVTFWVRGSSYRMTVSSCAFGASFSMHSPEQTLSAGSFRGSWLPSAVRLKGYSSQLVWNGWACPHFTREEGLRLVGMMGGQLRFDAAADSFIDVPGAFGGQAQYDGRDWEIDGRQVHLYGIGSGAWCWRRLDRR